MEPVVLFGRILFGMFFVMMGTNHFVALKAMRFYAAAKGIPGPDIAVITTGVLLLLGGLSYVAGKYMWVGGMALITFFVVVTPIMHAFWREKDEKIKAIEMSQFFKNLALLGAVMMTLP